MTFKGSGDFNTAKHLGALTADFSAGGLNGTLEEVSSGATAYLKSDCSERSCRRARRG